MTRKVDAYIQEYYDNGEIEYNMWMHYNGLDFAFLHRNEEAGLFAQYYKRKMLSSSLSRDGMSFTDTHGQRISSESYDSLLAGIKGLENIDKGLISLIGGCTNLDIQSDLTIHLNGEEYPIVRNANGENYKSYDACGFSKKGVSFEELAKLDQQISQLPRSTKDKHK